MIYNIAFTSHKSSQHLLQLQAKYGQIKHDTRSTLEINQKLTHMESAGEGHLCRRRRILPVGVLKAVYDSDDNLIILLRSVSTKMYITYILSRLIS